MTSLFSTSFMCRRCGREICYECFQIVGELTKPIFHGPRGNVDDVELAARRKKLQEKYARTSASFLSCSRRNDPHIFSGFTPVTRFAQPELNRAVEEMQRILDDTERSEIRSQTSPQREDQNCLSDTVYSFPDPIISPVYDDFTPPNTPAHVASIPIQRAQIIPASYYDPVFSNSTCNGPAFSSLWEKGLPLLVKDVLPRFKLTWNPEYFINEYGGQSCTIVECQTELTRSVCVKDFFAWFGNYENRSECWKLKVRTNFLSMIRIRI
jgi:lysine-specific demethylase 3